MDKRQLLCAYVKHVFSDMRKTVDKYGKGNSEKTVSAIKDVVLTLQQGTGSKRDRRKVYNIPNNAFYDELREFYAKNKTPLTKQEAEKALNLVYNIGDYLTNVLIQGTGIKGSDTSEVLLDHTMFEKLPKSAKYTNTSKVLAAMQNIEKKVVSDYSWMKPIDQQRGSELYFACAAAQQNKVDFKSIVNPVRNSSMQKPNWFYFTAADYVETKPLQVKSLVSPTNISKLESTNPQNYMTMIPKMISNYTSTQDGGQVQ